MEVLDYSIIACYFAIILWIARWASKGKEDKEFSSVDYFLAGKDQSWVVIGASLFASNISSVGFDTFWMGFCAFLHAHRSLYHA
jgi:SSS family solute:Na+ symporter